MARSSSLVKPASQELLRLEVLRTERLSPHWMRITLGGGEIDRFAPMGFDQWFRLFLPHSGEGGDEALELGRARRRGPHLERAAVAA